MQKYRIQIDFKEFQPPEPSLMDEYLVKEITEKFFGDDLLFGIIETTTISTVQSVGTSTYIAKNREFVESLHAQYEEIITKIKALPFGGPSQYFDWYQRKEFPYIIGTNDIHKSNPVHNHIDPLCSILVIPEKPKADQYIQDYTTKLEEQEIYRFMQEYVKCFLRKEWFEEIPNYFILVMPFSVKESKIGYFIPLGNLYIVIGTKSQFNLNKYQKYIQTIKLLWFKDFGAKLLKEYSEKRISTQHKPNNDLGDGKKHSSLTKLLQKEILLDQQEYEPISFEELFHYTFDFGKFDTIVSENFMNADHVLIKDIIHSNHEINNVKDIIKDKKTGFFDNNSDPDNILTKNIKKLKGFKRLNEKSVIYFVQLLSKRRLALVLYFILDYTLKDVQECIISTTSTDSQYETQIKYLSENLYIYSNKIQNKKMLSDSEKHFLNSIVSQIKFLNIGVNTNPNVHNLSF